MDKFSRYSNIEQYRNFIKTLIERATYVGKDEEGTPLYDYKTPLPTIPVHINVKLHGTNGCFAYKPLTGEYWTQSRNRILSLQKDNDGMCAFMEKHRESLIQICQKIIVNATNSGDIGDLVSEDITIYLYGEWAGKGIQDKVAISELEKSFYVFDAKIKGLGDEEDSKFWVSNLDLEVPTLYNKINIYNVNDFKIWSSRIDLNFPEAILPLLEELRDEVEKRCPIAYELGVDGIGEGLVVSTNFKGRKIRFKVKGEKHAGGSKPKELPKIDTEKLQSIREFATLVVSHSRVEQGIKEVGAVDESNTPDFLRWFANDVIKEHTDTLTDNNLLWKDVAKEVSNEARKLFFIKLGYTI